MQTVLDTSIGLHDRLRQIVGGTSNAEFARELRFHPETVRRYLAGATPSIQFLAALATVRGVNPTWVILGTGPRQLSDIAPQVLAEAAPLELGIALGLQLQHLGDQMARVASAVQVVAKVTSLPEFQAVHASMSDVNSSSRESATAQPITYTSTKPSVGTTARGDVP